MDKNNKYGKNHEMNNAHSEQKSQTKKTEHTSATHTKPSAKGESCGVGKGSTEKCGKKTHTQDESTGTC